jgi:hypothetical protein
MLVLIVAATFLAAVTGMVGIVHLAGDFGPRVGDLVSFDRTNHAPFTSNARFTASRPKRAICMLDVATMQKFGGSLMVERRGSGPDRRYRAHWSGLRTSENADDCGKQADLVLSGTDIDALATAAGGFGVGHTTVLQWRSPGAVNLLQ